MKVLIQNYASPDSTEPLYICEALNSLDGVEANIWSASENSSVFDAFDTIKPEMFITHFGYMTNDVVKYLSNNKRIEMLVNVTGATQEVIDQFDEMVSSKNINCPLAFYNTPSSLNLILQRKVKLLSILHGADIYLSQQSVDTPEYEADLAIISNYDVKDRMSEITNSFDTYHYLSTNQEIAGEVDIVAPAMHLYGLYKRYKNILITQDTLCVPQVLFDSIFYGNNVFYLPKYDSQKEKMTGILKSSLKTDENITDMENKNASLIKDKIISSHTCLSRVKRMFSKIKHSEIAKQIDEQIKGLKNDYSNP